MTTSALPARPGASRRRQNAIKSLLLHLALTPLAILFLLPIYMMVIFSTHPESAIFATPAPLWFGHEFLVNLKQLEDDLTFSRVALNSLIISSIYTVISMLLTSLGGFAFAKYTFRGRAVLFTLILTTLTIPTFVTIIPQFVLVARFLHLNNTYWAVVLPTLANTIGIFYMRQSFMNVPDDLLAAARIDGAGEFRLFWQIALPVVRPSLAALGIILFLGSWNDYLWPLIVLSNKEAYTIPVALGTLVGLTRVSWGGIMVGTTLATIPFLILFLVLQRYFIAGITSGSVKS